MYINVQDKQRNSQYIGYSESLYVVMLGAILKLHFSRHCNIYQHFELISQNNRLPMFQMCLTESLFTPVFSTNTQSKNYTYFATVIRVNHSICSSSLPVQNIYRRLLFNSSRYLISKHLYWVLYLTLLIKFTMVVNFRYILLL